MAISRKKRILDDRAQTEVCAMITVGCSRAAAARLVGCTPNAIVGLAERDPLFAERLQAAEMKREFGPLHRINAASEKNWRAAAWILERVRPQSYSSRKKAAISPEQMREIGQMFVQCIDRYIEDPTEKEKLAQRFAERLDKLAEPPAPPTETPAEPQNEENSTGLTG